MVSSVKASDSRGMLVTNGPTIHDEDVIGHEVWTAAGSPHIVEWTVDVVNGGSLEIEPCAVVQFKEGHGLNVAFPGTPTTGSLIAEGTAKRPIRFEGYKGERWGHLFVHAPGTVDAGYRGEIKVTLLNTDVTEAVKLVRGDRVAQLVIQKVERARFLPAETLPGSHRGEGGFGSSGGFAGR